MVPPVDTTFRPAVNDVLVSGNRRSMSRGAVRAFISLLLAACIGVAAFAWRSWGDTAEKKIVTWATQLVMTASLLPEKPGPAAQPAAPAAQVDAANAVPPQPAPPAQIAPETVAPAAVPSPDSAQLLQSMARDLASAGQEIEQLKASVEQLKASQQQMSRDLAVKVSEVKASEIKASEQNLRPRKPAPPPRSAAAPMRPPLQPYPPRQAATAPPLPPAAAPYPPRQLDPQSQTTAEPLTDPELASVPRPPMPLR
jgi:hypothetical protein